MTTYRVTFEDGEQQIITSRTINQALACAVRNDKYDRDIVQVERWTSTQDERADIARFLNKQQGAKY